MEPFNIKITRQNQPVVLTVLPTDKGYFKLIYFGAVLAALQQSAPGDWTLLSNEEIEAGDLPYYTPGTADNDSVEIISDSEFVAHAGAAIEVEQAQQNQSS